MRQRPGSSSKALPSVSPQNSGDWRVVIWTGVCLLGAIVFVTAVFYVKHLHQLEREQSWASAIATIQDVRPRLVTQFDSSHGGTLLYDVDVLAQYPVDGGMQEQWITLSQSPKTMDAVRLQEFSLKGKHCFVRWKPSDLKAIVAEIQ